MSILVDDIAIEECSTGVRDTLLRLRTVIASSGMSSDVISEYDVLLSGEMRPGDRAAVLNEALRMMGVHRTSFDSDKVERRYVKELLRLDGVVDFSFIAPAKVTRAIHRMKDGEVDGAYMDQYVLHEYLVSNPNVLPKMQRMKLIAILEVNLVELKRMLGSSGV